VEPMEYRREGRRGSRDGGGGREGEEVKVMKLVQQGGALGSRLD
jgi:hypothetical protein